MLDKVKNYLIIPLSETDEDEFLNFLIEAAKKKLAASGINKSQSENFKTLYELLICMIVCFWHEHRDEQGNIPAGAVGLINEIRYSGGESLENQQDET